MQILDLPATASSSYLDGTGKELSPGGSCLMRWSAHANGRMRSCSARPPEQLLPNYLASYSYASVKGSEQVQSEDYLRARSQVSHYVLVRFVLKGEGVDTVLEYVASVRFFVRATDTAALLRAHTAAEKLPQPSALLLRGCTRSMRRTPGMCC